jgi:iron complex transport system ATP-binding protein
MSAEVVMACEGLAVGYRSEVLSGVDLAFEAGQFVSLLGANGVGKTTFLRTLSRHLPPLKGRVRVAGRDLEKLPAHELARQVAVVLTNGDKPPLLTVFEFAALGRYPHTGFMGRLAPRDVGVVEESLKAVMAEGLASRYIDQLSDGERQKAVLARALAQAPRVLLLDEPTAHLDLKHRVEIMTILRKICRDRGLTVIASLHDVDIAAKISDRAVLMKKGRVTGCGLPEEVLTSEAVAGLYDFNGVAFSRHLGSIELKDDGSAGRAFVTAGRGSGTDLFRLLAKKNIAIDTGILAEGDLDAYVATALGARTFVRTDGADEGVLGQATAALRECDFVVDSGQEAAGTAELNRAILAAACRQGIPVLTMRGDDERAGCRHCGDVAELSRQIDLLCARPARAADRTGGGVRAS